MSVVTGTTVFIFHTDLGPVVTEVSTVRNYDVEDIIKRRAISMARSVQFLNMGKRFSPNDPAAPRTISSVYSSSDEELV